MISKVAWKVEKEIRNSSGTNVHDYRLVPKSDLKEKLCNFFSRSKKFSLPSFTSINIRHFYSVLNSVNGFINGHAFLLCKNRLLFNLPRLAMPMPSLFFFSILSHTMLHLSACLKDFASSCNNNYLIHYVP